MPVAEPQDKRGTPLRKGGVYLKHIGVVETFDRLPNSAELPLGAVAALEGISTPTEWRWIKAGLLPQPKSVGGMRRINVGELRAVRAARAALSEGEVRQRLSAIRNGGAR